MDGLLGVGVGVALKLSASVEWWLLPGAGLTVLGLGSDRDDERRKPNVCCGAIPASSEPKNNAQAQTDVLQLAHPLPVRACERRFRESESFFSITKIGFLSGGFTTLALTDSRLVPSVHCGL